MRRVGCLRLFVVALLLAWWATQHFREWQGRLALVATLDHQEKEVANIAGTGTGARIHSGETLYL